MRSDDVCQATQHRLRIPQLHAEENVIGRAECGGIIACAHFGKIEFTQLAFHAQAVLTNCREMGSARDETYLAAAFGQPGAEIAAHASCTYDRDPHAPLAFLNYFAVGRGSPGPV